MLTPCLRLLEDPCEPGAAGCVCDSESSGRGSELLAIGQQSGETRLGLREIVDGTRRSLRKGVAVGVGNDDAHRGPYGNNLGGDGTVQFFIVWPRRIYASG
jgi:hypothetical protein